MPIKVSFTHFLKFWLPVYLYAGLIFYFSAQSSPPIGIGILYGDKLLHLAEYAILGYLLARAAINSTSLKLQMYFRLFAVCAAILYGLSDEFHQCFISERETDIFDALADSVGAFLGQLLIRIK